VSVEQIAGHALTRDSAGRLLPWTSWEAALELEMRYYQTCPWDHGYPRFAGETFLDGGWNPNAARSDIIPATQNGMGIISYLKLHQWSGQRRADYLVTARALGDYLLREALTPADAAYPNFIRSTGRRALFPQPPDAGSQSDRPYEIQPDKGGVAGYALTTLYEATGDSHYLECALHHARTLAATQAPGTDRESPWAFRVDYRDGTGRGAVASNMVYILRLYDVLVRIGFTEFVECRGALWDWIRQRQIPSAASDGALFAQFFEDHDTPTNRNAWAPLNLARYLLEERERMDAQWRELAQCLIDFVRRVFTHTEFGITVCHEQDEDHQAWNGINSTYGAVLLMYATAIGDDELALQAHDALNFTLYSIDETGRPRDVFNNPSPGGWQEDAHTDVIHNVVDAIRATRPER
jgi:hypothetical protein